MKLGATGTLARVTAVAAGGDLAYLEFLNGQSGSAENPDVGLKPGDVLLISGDEGSRKAQAVPSELWPAEPWVGVVRIKLDDITVIDSSGRLRRVPTTSEVSYNEGNTVEAGDYVGVTRVLAEQPIKYIDLPAIDDSVVERFRQNTDTGLTFEDFGGLTNIVARARELIELPLLHHDRLGSIGARPIKGVLFTGPPGTGKTMLARIIAAQAEAEFFEISGPEIFSKWYGQSEELLRKIFEAASNNKAIIFFDEIDSVAAQRDGDAHEASRRVVAQLLTLMDGFNSTTNVVVIAATNRPQDLDVALRRPGRFDWEIEFPFPDLTDREDILMKTARHLETAERLPHKYLAERTVGWSPAELAAVWSEAALLAVADDRGSILAEDYVGGFERVARQRDRIGRRQTPETAET